MNIKIPRNAKYIIDMLENSGFEAYVVGGCVRDSILGEAPQDWDICTPALPEQIIEIFAGHNIIRTGLKHGTVTLVLDKPFEVTTYRVDGKYKDNRRPEQVKFVNVLKRDLARRDFTINALAYNPKTGLKDYYNGQLDLSERKIKCVGNPNKRLRDDALRIMRALRFAATYGFEIEDNTAAAMRENKKLLHNISGERIALELNKLIISDGAGVVLLAYADIIAELIPGFASKININNAPKDIIIRLALLLRDINAHEILSRLKYDNGTVSAVTQLLRYIEEDINTWQIKRWLNKIGVERFRQLLAVKKAMQDSENFDNILVALDKTITQRECFSLKDLAVNGKDLIALGTAQGAAVGVILNKLLDMVIDDEIDNSKASLLEAAEIQIKNFIEPIDKIVSLC